MGCEKGSDYLFSALPAGPRNLITDVPGVRVGHVTFRDGDVNTGVTALLPHGGNIFKEKLAAACTVINGFGKTTGLMQITELGTLETPIVLTNTLSVGTAYTALVRYTLANNADVGVETGTVNPVVCECNDGELNDIRSMVVREEDVLAAIGQANEDFAEGVAGAGTGMVCYGFKGGIGSASRMVEIEGQQYCVGCLVLTNHGQPGNLRIKGQLVSPGGGPADDKGSVIVLLATDAPLDSRQLGRACRRAGAGLGRGGSVIGNGSGEVVIGFSTASRIPHYPAEAVQALPTLHEDYMDAVFRGVVEAVEDAVLSSMLHAEAVTGVRGNSVKTLRDVLSGRE